MPSLGKTKENTARLLFKLTSIDHNSPTSPPDEKHRKKKTIVLGSIRGSFWDGFGGYLSTYVSSCKIPTRRRDMVDSAFES